LAIERETKKNLLLFEKRDRYEKDSSSFLSQVGQKRRLRLDLGIMPTTPQQVLTDHEISKEL